mmetsp:Transcript_17338/g.17018  ORF Transcript_17338/g.17018 Transcript_17338/m.17018 type:complete len:163 (-) Transcript_17338:38-526(-)|eukprot:CAMPEP_0197002416 /NCGR_PEP_ID=MMETSP1380-20130617/6906_1 /TAXON_ID=5936 /ORGANISM="Euplotes crassus, Strain CT5" /LENGTH=162 /DNA_ID=CAMNT_0042420517 /DNA_START=722 /DNA_END=1210 /DNA_ORIENTATION=+
METQKRQTKLQDIMNKSHLKVRRLKHCQKNKRLFDCNGNPISAYDLALPTVSQPKLSSKRNQREQIDKTVTFDFRKKESDLKISKSTAQKGLATPNVSDARNNNLSLSQLINSRGIASGQARRTSENRKYICKNLKEPRSSSLSHNLAEEIQLTPMIEVLPK